MRTLTTVFGVFEIVLGSPGGPVVSHDLSRDLRARAIKLKRVLGLAPTELRWRQRISLHIVKLRVDRRASQNPRLYRRYSCKGSERFAPQSAPPGLERHFGLSGTIRGV